MLRSVLPTVLALALVCATACTDSKPAGKTDPETEAKAKAGADSDKPAPAKPEIDPPNPTTEPAETLAGDRPSAPAWFDASKIEHEAIVSQIASQEAVAGGFASALILELAPGTTNEQCIATARKTLGETITDLGEPTASDDRMLLQGKTDGYDYMIVCGQAKGKPTLYLSYTTP